MFIKPKQFLVFCAICSILNVHGSYAVAGSSGIFDNPHKSSPLLYHKHLVRKTIPRIIKDTEKNASPQQIFHKRQLRRVADRVRGRRNNRERRQEPQEQGQQEPQEQGQQEQEQGQQEQEQGQQEQGQQEQEQGQQEQENEDPPFTEPSGLPADESFCNAVNLGNVIADGTQQRTSTCSTTVQGAIPSANKMVSSIIISPRNGEELKAGQDFTITVRTLNMKLGFFEDPQARYYLTPQTLDNQGLIEGHQHVTMQALGSGTTPPNPEVFTAFKGLNGPPGSQGDLSTVVEGATTAGLTGEFRICTMTGTRGHQPCIMPVAQRGAQDDCIRMTLVA